MSFRNVEVTRPFKEMFNSKKPIIVQRGGARSSKSYSVLQFLIYILTNEPNPEILIIRKTMPSLRLTAYKVFVDLLKDYGYYNHCDHSKTENTIIYRPTNAFVAFTSIQDPERIKSSEWNIVFMEEANEFSYDDYMILKLRLSAPTKTQNKLIMALNPISAFHWIKTKLVDIDPDLEEIVSTYKDNPFLSYEYIKQLLKIKLQDRNYWKIYGEGQWGVLDHVIYSSWNVIQSEAWPESFDDTIYGVDFGFNVESALTETNFKDGLVYERELLYEAGLTNTKLIEKVKTLIPKNQRSCYLFADNAEPDRIQEFCDAGFNCHPADKSVKDGINHVKDCDINIHADSANLIKEKRGYSWKTDKNGNVLDEPIKWMDHLVDSERYALYTYHKMLSEGRPSFRVV